MVPAERVVHEVVSKARSYSCEICLRSFDDKALQQERAYFQIATKQRRAGQICELVAERDSLGTEFVVYRILIMESCESEKWIWNDGKSDG